MEGKTARGCDEEPYFPSPKKYGVPLSVAAAVACERISGDNEQKKMTKRGDGEGWLSGFEERRQWRGLLHVGCAVTRQRRPPAPALSLFAFFLLFFFKKTKKTKADLTC